MSTNSKVRACTDRHASIDELDRSIVNLAVQLNRITHDFLVLIRRFDERAGWLQWSCESCAEWLHYRCDLSKSAAREKVRVAHAIKTLPAIAVAFAEGRLSYSKVRALTRVATPKNEDELLTFALKTTAARVEERCRELRCGTAASIDDAVRAHARRELWMARDPARPGWCGSPWSCHSRPRSWWTRRWTRPWKRKRPPVRSSRKRAGVPNGRMRSWRWRRITSRVARTLPARRTSTR